MQRLADYTKQLTNQAARFTAGRYLQALAINKGDLLSAVSFAEAQHQWADQRQIVSALKSATSPITTGDFPGALQPVADSFIDALRDFSIPLRLQGLRKVPMLTLLYVNSSGVIVTEVAEGSPVPVLAGDWTSATLTPRKFAGICVQTSELLRATSPTAALAIVDDLAKATAAAENEAFLDANVAGSVLFGQANFAAAGSSLANVDSDLAHLVSLVKGAADADASFVMAKQTATFLGLLRGTGGAAAFPNIGPSGGSLLGLQVLVSTAAEDGDSPSSKIIALLSPSEIFWADQGSVILSTSSNASLQMSDTPSNLATSTVSLWQSNAVATKALRESAWYARSGAAAFMRTTY